MNSSSTSSSKAPLWKRILVAAGFVAGLLGLFAWLNSQGGKGRIQGDIWFSAIAGSGVGHTADALFLGSSRVSAAVDSRVFDQILSQVLGRQIQSANMGMGYSTVAEWAMGLRRLQELNPEAIRGSVVFIEAPMGLPEYKTWDDTWVVDPAPELMSRYLTKSDLPALFRSNTPAVQKGLVAANVLFGYDENITRVRRSFQKSFDDATLSLFSSVFPIPKEDQATDLTSRGGIRNDKKGVEDAKSLAMNTVKQELSDTLPRRDWDKTTLLTVVQRLRELGAQPIFFEMPMSPTMATIYETPLRIQDRVHFQEVLEIWGVPYLAPRIATTAEDFPDIWHLRKSRAPEFTQNLTVEFLEKFVYPAIRQAQAAQAAQAARGAAAPVRTDSVQAK